MHDIAQMKSLLPDLITFAYIDSELLRIHSAGAEAGDDAAAARARKRQELDEEYERAARGVREGEFQGEGKEAAKARKETVLLFKFNDGELKSSNGVGKVITRKFQCVFSLHDLLLTRADSLPSSAFAGARKRRATIPVPQPPPSHPRRSPSTPRSR